MRGRRITGTTLLLLAPLIPLLLFGVARAAAPFSLLGLVFHHPWAYALVAAAVVVAGALVMSLRPVEAWAARVLFGMRAPTDAERAAVAPGLDRVAETAGMDPERLLLRIEDSGAPNAYAAAGHIVCVTTAALRLPAAELEAVLAHELGHHTELHPQITAMAWWLNLPAVPLKALLRWLRGIIAAIAARLRGLGRPVALILNALLWLVALQLLWLVWVADLLAAAMARQTEYAADARAVHWGYGPELLAAFGTLGAGEAPTGRIERLADNHPPLERRVARIQDALKA